jgi:prepilin peptidase CpaA
MSRRPSSIRGMHVMDWFFSIIPYAEVLILLYAAFTDVATRLISNKICLLLAALAIVRLPFGEPQQLLASVYGAAVLFVLLLVAHSRGYVGGGDVKLLTVLSVGLPVTSLIQFLTITVLTGGVLAVLHLMMRVLPYPALPPVGSSLVRRIYAVERWRNLRRAPLPYGMAIACGGIWTVLSHGVGT